MVLRTDCSLPSAKIKTGVVRTVDFGIPVAKAEKAWKKLIKSLNERAGGVHPLRFMAGVKDKNEIAETLGGLGSIKVGQVKQRLKNGRAPFPDLLRQIPQKKLTFF